MAALCGQFPPGHKFIENNLEGSKKSLTRVQRTIGRKKGRTIPDSALFVSSSKAERGVGRGGGYGGSNKGKLDSRGGSGGFKRSRQGLHDERLTRRSFSNVRVVKAVPGSLHKFLDNLFLCCFSPMVNNELNFREMINF